MAQIVEGEFEIQEVPAGDKTVPMFVGVRGRRVFTDRGEKRRRESLIAIPVGAVSIAEIMDEDDEEGDQQRMLSHWHGGLQHRHFTSGGHDHSGEVVEKEPSLVGSELFSHQPEDGGITITSTIPVPAAT